MVAITDLQKMRMLTMLKYGVIRYSNPIHARMLYWWIAKWKSEVLEISSRPAVVFAPHQDDETFGCGGMISLKRRLGIKVAVVFMTDGSGSLHSGTFATSERLVKIRHSEAVKAAGILGVDAKDLHFWNLPDTTLNALEGLERQAVVLRIQKILAAIPSAEIFVPHRRDIHPDHEATFDMVAEAIRNLPGRHIIFEYAVWMTWLAKIGRTLNLTDLEGAWRLPIQMVQYHKKLAIDSYLSQNRALPPHFIDRFLLPFEIFFQRRRGGKDGSSGRSGRYY